MSPRKEISNLKSLKQENNKKSLKKVLTGDNDRKSKRMKSIDLRIDLKRNINDPGTLVQMLKRRLNNSVSEPMPSHVKPMLATLIEEPFNDESWQFEIKHDGYRALAYVLNGKAHLRSRNDNNFSHKFSPICEELAKWNMNVLADGEIVVLDEYGKPDFNGIQQWELKKQGVLVYYVFDLLWFDGMNIMNEPLSLRRELLKQLIPDNGIIRFSDHIDTIGKDFYLLAKQNNLEGIIAKNKNSSYIPDSRTRNWLKVKVEQRHEAIICGYIKKKRSDRLFSSLILGIKENGKFKYLGQAGTGYTALSLKEIMRKMKPLATTQSPFEYTPLLQKGAVWLKPELGCEVKYTEITSEGVMRHASFQGLIEDKKINNLNLAGAKKTADIQKKEINKSGRPIQIDSNEKLIKLDGHDLKLTNLLKKYWPKENITKGDMLNYYLEVSDFILPYMKDRPQSLNRFPNGVNGDSFYHKNMGGKVDNWLKTFKRFSETNGVSKDFLICTDKASLIYMANLGCIEMNPWHSRVQAPNYPDWTVIDIDPGNISFEKVIETACVIKKILDEIHVISFPKTSGSTGIHIYIPLGAKYNYAQAKQLAELIANMAHEELPGITSLIRNPLKRTDKIYIDYLQNRPIQTICSPYSLRPKPGATVSTPLHWDEVKKGLKISNFTIKNMMERLKTEGDLFGGVLGTGIDLNKVLKGIATLL